MTSSTQITGGCLCGAVRYRVDGVPLAARVCWCRLCQYLGGGSGTVNVAFLTSAMRIAGATSDYVCDADSGSRMHRRFCPACGTPLFSAAESRPHLIFVRAGTLDDPELARPEVTIWTAQAPGWACISETLPRIAGQPPPAG